MGRVSFFVDPSLLDEPVVCQKSYRSPAVEAGVWLPKAAGDRLPQNGSIPAWVRFLWHHHPECRATQKERRTLQRPLGRGEGSAIMRRINGARVAVVRRALGDEEEKQALLMEAEMARLEKRGR